MNYIPTLTIAGSDSSGGAGIQADIKTMSALGCYAMSVITSVTAQNTCSVSGIHPIPSEMVARQLSTVMDDILPLSIKTGMLYDSEIIQVIASKLKDYSGPLIIDPVMVATSSDRLLNHEAEETLRRELIPVATLITPNLQEAEVLSGVKITNEDTLNEAGLKLMDLGCKAALIKGGHSYGVEATDYLFTSNRVRKFSEQRIDSHNTHGTGCTLSAAIAAFMARGLPLDEAILEAKAYLTKAIQSGKDASIGRGHGPVDHFFQPINSIKTK